MSVCSKSSVLSSPYYITTPIYYVNSKPHLGHYYSTLLADVFARWNRQKGKLVYFQTGTDEHGQKIQEAALRAKVPPQTFCNNIAEKFRQLFSVANFTHDHFHRTTDPSHHAFVQAIWRELVAKDLIYQGTYAGWYNISEESFVPKTNVVEREGKHYDSESGKMLVWQEESNYLFRLSKFKDQLLKFYTDNPNWIAPAYRQREIVTFVASGLEDLSVSRKASTCSWGIPVPTTSPNSTPTHVPMSKLNGISELTSDGNRGKPDVLGSSEEKLISDSFIYVWLDALSNYLSGPDARSNADAQSSKLITWPADVQIVGKDILKFHAVYWPAFLMALDLPLPKRILAHGWWTVNQEKMAKSLGNVVDPEQLLTNYHPEALRYYLLRESTYASDTEFNLDRLESRYKSDLAGGLGNLVNRIIVKKIFPSRVVPVPKRKSWTHEDFEVVQIMGTLAEKVDDCLTDHLDCYRALETIWNAVGLLNNYLHLTKPWRLVKAETGSSDHDSYQQVIYILMESLRILSLVISPFLPQSATIVQNLFPPPMIENPFEFGRLRGGEILNLSEERLILWESHLPQTQ